MDSDYYEIKVLHFLHPHLIWVQVANNSNGDQVKFEQIGLYGVVPMIPYVADDCIKWKHESNSQWQPAVKLIMDELFKSSSSVWFSLIKIESRTSIFDDNLHAFGEIYINKPKGEIEKLSACLTSRGMGIENESLFLQEFSSGHLHTKLDHLQTKEVVANIESYYTKKVSYNHAALYVKCLKKQTSIFHMAENFQSAMSLQTSESFRGVKFNMSKDEVNKVIKNKLEVFESCKGADDVSIGTANRYKSKIKSMSSYSLAQRFKRYKESMIRWEHLLSDFEKSQSESSKEPLNVQKSPETEDKFVTSNPRWKQDKRMEPAGANLNTLVIKSATDQQCVQKKTQQDEVMKKTDISPYDNSDLEVKVKRCQQRHTIFKEYDEPKDNITGSSNIENVVKTGSEPQSVVFEKMSKNRRKFDKSDNWAQLEEDLSNVYFLSAQNPSEFYVGLEKYTDSWEILNKNIQDYVNNEKLNPIENINTGDIVIAKYEGDSFYYRARIDEILKDKVKCFYVDEGDWGYVPMKYIISIPDRFVSTLPFQAIECRLVGIKPFGEEWTDSAINWFCDRFYLHNLIYVKHFKKTPAVHTGDYRYDVAAVDTHTEKDIIINQELLDLNLAQENEEDIIYLKDLKFDNEPEISDAKVDDFKEEKYTDYTPPVQPANTFLRQPIRSVPLVQSEDESDISDDVRDFHASEDFKSMLAPQNVQRSNTHTNANLPDIANATAVEGSKAAVESNSTVSSSTIEAKIEDIENKLEVFESCKDADDVSIGTANRYKSKIKSMSSYSLAQRFKRYKESMIRWEHLLSDFEKSQSESSKEQLNVQKSLETEDKFVTSNPRWKQDKRMEPAGANLNTLVIKSATDQQCVQKKTQQDEVMKKTDISPYNNSDLEVKVKRCQQRHTIFKEYDEPKDNITGSSNIENVVKTGSEPQSVVFEKMSKNRRKFDKSDNWAQLEEDLSNVYFLSAQNPSEFYVGLEKYTDSWEILNKNIQDYVNNEKLNPIENINTGDIVIAKYEGDSFYYRARIDEILKDKVKCFYVDEGDWGYVPMKYIISIPDRFVSTLPFQAIECRLVGIKPFGEEWTDSAINWFCDRFYLHNLIYVKHFKKTPAVHTGDYRYDVAAVDTHTEKDIIINQELLDLNLAQENEEDIIYLKDLNFDNEPEISDAKVDDFKEEKYTDYTPPVQPANTFLRQPIRSVPLVQSEDESDISDDVRDFHASEDFKSMLAPQNVQRSNTHTNANLPDIANTTAVEGSKASVESNSTVSSSTIEAKIEDLDKAKISDSTPAHQYTLDSHDLPSPEKTNPLNENSHKNQIDLLRKPKIRWFQNKTEIIIKIELIVEKYEIEIKDRYLKFEATANNGKYGFDMDLFLLVSPENSHHTNKGLYVRVTLKKYIMQRNWLTLSRDNKMDKWIVYDGIQ